MNTNLPDRYILQDLWASKTDHGQSTKVVHLCLSTQSKNQDQILRVYNSIEWPKNYSHDHFELPQE